MFAADALNQCIMSYSHSKTKARLNPAAIPIVDTGVNQQMVFYGNAKICFGSYSVTNLRLTKSLQAENVFLWSGTLNNR